MLQQFSWTQFLISSAILSAIWYLLLSLTVYRRELLAFFSGARAGGGAAVVTVDIGKNSEADLLAFENQLMGRSKMPEGLETVSMASLSFSAGESDGYNAGKIKSDQLGLVPDVLEELKEIFSLLARENGSKQDFLSLAEMITGKYGPIGSHPNISQINEFIRERAPFAISSEELDNLWD